MQKGSYVWEVTIKVKWDYQDESETFESYDYTVASPSFDGACQKALGIIRKDPNFKKQSDTQDDGKVNTFEVERFEITEVERGIWING